MPSLKDNGGIIADFKGKIKLLLNKAGVDLTTPVSIYHRYQNCQRIEGR